MENNGLSLLRSKRLFVLDMDGTFYLGGRLLEGSLEFINRVRETGRSFLFFTNNSSKTGEFYREKLHGMGCEVDARSIITSGDVTVDFLKKHRPGKTVFLLAPESVRESFAAAGIPLDDRAPDIVVAAFDMELTYRRLCDACTFIRNGAEFLATHPDFNCPVEGGFLPDCGAICALITSSTGKTPKILGKPHAETLEAVIRATGVPKEEIVFVGDRLYTDIAIGVRHGVTAALVLSGETTPEMLAQSDIKPDLVVPRLVDLAEGF